VGKWQKARIIQEVCQAILKSLSEHDKARFAPHNGCFSIAPIGWVLTAR